jgi:hypothetical protein
MSSTFLNIIAKRQEKIKKILQKVNRKLSYIAVSQVFSSGRNELLKSYIKIKRYLTTKTKQEFKKKDKKKIKILKIRGKYIGK